MDHRGTNLPPRMDARSRRQRRAESIQRITSALAQNGPTTHSSADSSPAPQFPNIRGRISGAVPSQSHLQRHRLRRMRGEIGFETVQETVNDLDNDQRTSQIDSAVMNQTLPVLAGNDEFTGVQENAENQGRRSKRRKLDADPLGSYPPIHYGYHGQVAPGRLNMMISYCDGGHLHEERQYSPDNVLRNDKSVYCSRRSKVNLMLSHWGEVPFTCTKIVIKTPESGFPSPVQEGMVFVFMGGNNILENTSQFQPQDFYPYSYQRDSPPPPQDLAPLRTRLRLSNGEWQIDSSGNRRESSTMTHDPLPAFDFDAFLAGDNQPSRPVTSSSQEDLPPLRRVPRRDPAFRATSAYHDNISTSCDPPSGDEEDPTSEIVLEDRGRRALQFESDSDEDQDGGPYSNSYRSRRQSSLPRPIEWTGKDPTSTTGDIEPPGPNVPYKSFFIEYKKHVVSIKFDPPVSGKHILLKLWSPQGRDSLELQSVCVYGFAGPRFFPVLATR